MTGSMARRTPSITDREGVLGGLRGWTARSRHSALALRSESRHSRHRSLGPTSADSSILSGECTTDAFGGQRRVRMAWRDRPVCAHRRRSAFGGWGRIVTWRSKAGLRRDTRESGARFVSAGPEWPSPHWLTGGRWWMFGRLIWGKDRSYVPGRRSSRSPAHVGNRVVLTATHLSSGNSLRVVSRCSRKAVVAIDIRHSNLVRAPHAPRLLANKEDSDWPQAGYVVRQFSPISTRGPRSCLPPLWLGR